MQEKTTQGLGGWLILLLMGLIISPVWIIYGLIDEFLPIFTDDTWRYLTDAHSVVYHPLWAPFIIGKMLTQIFSAIFCIFLLWHAFKRSTRFPTLMIISFIGEMIIWLIDCGIVIYLRSYMPPDFAQQMQFDSNDRRDGCVLLIRCFIWIPYLLYSKRVINTFTKPPDL